VQAFTIEPQGPFSLEEAATFGFGQRSSQVYDGVMRLAFCLDDFSGHVGVEVRQDDTGVHCTFEGSTDVEAVKRQVARVLSLDHDANDFVKVGDRDPVMAQLQAAAPGLRPPLFYSPYEAAAWAVLSSRRPPQQMQQVRQRLSEANGASFKLAGQTLAALPTPAQILAIDTFPEIPTVKMDRLHAVARGALEGQLDPERIRSQDPDVAMKDLQQIKGIGPFYSALILIRASGVTDVLPPNEPRVREIARRLYGLDATPSVEQFADVARPWAPWRTWGVVVMRAAGSRVLRGGDSAPDE
jgi:DNA-3-methyladenine glycosylase II